MDKNEIMAKLSPEDREALAQEIGREVEQAINRAEAARAEANDPEAIFQKNLENLYGGARVRPEKTDRERVHEAMDSWEKGERWPSNSLYPSMDYEAREAFRADAERRATEKNSDFAAQWAKEQKAKGDK